MTGGTSLDLEDIGFAAGTTVAIYKPGSGLLTVTDGAHISDIHLAGDYAGSTFTTSSDGHGGTIVVDPTKSAAAQRFAAAMASFAPGPAGPVHAATASWAENGRLLAVGRAPLLETERPPAPLTDWRFAANLRPSRPKPLDERGMRILSNLTAIDKGEYTPIFHRFEYYVQMSRDEEKAAKKALRKLGIERDVLYSEDPFSDGYLVYVTVGKALWKGAAFEHKDLAKVEANRATVLDRLTDLAARLGLPVSDPASPG